MKTLNRWLVIKADGDVRIRTRRPATGELGYDEFAIPLTINIPDPWGRIASDGIDITLPEPPEVTATVEFDDDVTVIS